LASKTGAVYRRAPQKALTPGRTPKSCRLFEPAPLDLGRVFRDDSCELKLVDPERVRSVQAAMPDPDFVDELAKVFGWLPPCSPASSRREASACSRR